MVGCVMGYEAFGYVAICQYMLIEVSKPMSRRRGAWGKSRNERFKTESDIPHMRPL